MHMMNGKGAKEVLRSLDEFIKVEPECKSIISDEDTVNFQINT